MWRYTIRPGDNLIMLGKKHLINADDWKALQRLNHIRNPYRLVIGSVVSMPLDLVKQSAASAEVVFVSGDAQWQQTATQWVPLEAGKSLGPGAKITTKENSKVVLRFADGSTTDLVSNSTLSLDALSLYSGGAMVDTKLRLQKGQVETHANPRHVKGNQMQVTTPSAIAAVRGTRFRVTAGEKATTQETLDGQVALNASNQVVAVSKGFGSKAEQGKKPIPPVVLLSAVNTSSLNTEYEALPVTFDVPEMKGAVAWVAKVATDADFNQVVTEGEFTSNKLTFSDVPDGTLYLNLRAKDHNGIVGYEAVHAFNLNARPFQPEIPPSEVDMLVREPQPTLEWRAVADAKQYTVEVAADEAFKQIVEMKQIGGLAVKLDKPLAPGKYYWRVSSIAQADNGELEKGPASKVNRLSYQPAPMVPDISQLTVNIERNRVFVRTLPPLDGLSYHASLDNPFNKQTNVWQGSELGGEFDFLLREYGKQTLYIRHVDNDGTQSAPAVYEFDAQPK